MKRTNPENIVISKVIGQVIKVTFENEEFHLNGWGEVDNYFQMNNNTFLFVECENSQKHPNTNVLKLWPFIEENEEYKIILFHFFFRKNKAPKNRLKLCDFTASKIRQAYPNRFQYINLESDVDEIGNIIAGLKKGLVNELLMMRTQEKRNSV